MIKNTPIHGIVFLLHGFRMLTRKGLKRFVIIPLLLNVFIYGSLVSLGYHYIHQITHLLPQGWHWLAWLIYPLFFLSSGIITAYTFTILTNLISCPFNSFLAEKVYLLKTGKKPTADDSWNTMIKNIPRTIKREGHKILYFLPRALFLLVLFIIPGINVIAGFLWILFGSWMMSVEYVDYIFDLQKKPLKELLFFLRSHCWLSLGFGFMTLILAMIPIINLLVIPAAVIGGTLMAAEN